MVEIGKNLFMCGNITENVEIYNEWCESVNHWLEKLTLCLCYNDMIDVMDGWGSCSILTLTGLEQHICLSLVKGLEGHICPSVVTPWWHHCDVI